MADKKKKDFNPILATPVGRCNYINLKEPDTGRQYSDNKFKLDLLFDMETWKNDAAAKALRAEVLKVAKKAIKKGVITKLCGEFEGKDPKSVDLKTLKLTHFANPFKKGDDKDMSNENYHCYKNTIFITPKKKAELVEKFGREYPIVVGPDKKDWSLDEVAKIKSGDHVRCSVSVYPYPHKDGGGVTFGLELVQFVKAGEPFFTGGVKAASMSVIGELEVELEDIDDESLDGDDGAEDGPDEYDDDELDDVEL